MQLFVSIFAGLTMVMIALHYDWPSEVMGGVCGMAGWSGASLIKALERRFSIKRQEETMKISDDGMALIKRFEGLRLQAYQDSVGVWTIGYGWPSRSQDEKWVPAWRSMPQRPSICCCAASPNSNRASNGGWR